MQLTPSMFLSVEWPIGWNLRRIWKLSIDGSTIKSHVSIILSNLGLRHRGQAVVFAYESDLVQRGFGARASTHFQMSAIS